MHGAGIMMCRRRGALGARGNATMGTWGANLFDDDTASDLREEWRELYAGCDSPAEATAELLEGWKDQLDEPEVGPVVYLTLAYLQHQYGCPDPTIQARALAIINGQEGLDQWRDAGPKELAARTRMYARLRKQLESPAPPLRKVRRKALERTTLRPGQLVRFALSGDEFTLIWVKGVGRYLGGAVPECVLLDWRGTQLPGKETILSLPPRQSKHDLYNIKYFQEVYRAQGIYEQVIKAGYTRYLLIDSHKRDYPAKRVSVLDGFYQFNLPPQPNDPIVLRWSDVPEQYAHIT